MILEGVVTTLDEDGAVHVAPMGPEVADGFERMLLRPFQTSRTFANLKRTGQGVLHVTDDVELIARAAIGQVVEIPPHRPAPMIQGAILVEACRWYAFQADSIDDRATRAVIPCRVVAAGRLRDFFGFNRAKHAVVEAAVLATRLSLLRARVRRRRDAASGAAGRQDRRSGGAAGFCLAEPIHSGVHSARREIDSRASA